MMSQPYDPLVFALLHAVMAVVVAMGHLLACLALRLEAKHGIVG
jgi:hypothetical protein